MPASYTYIDGNNNRYTIKRDEIVYRPITPADSSTGTYSGGAPATIELAPDAFEHLETLLQLVLDDTAHHLADRPMGSGTLSVGDQTVVIAARSRHKSELEAELRRLRSDAG